MTRLINRSGGITYHYFASRYVSSLWLPYRAQVELWLNHWAVPSENPLILIGPSGGYSLPSHWLTRFQNITVLEPDSLAKYLLQKRFPQIQFQFPKIKTLQNTLEFCQAHPTHTLLFTNLLGQIRHLTANSQEVLSIQNQVKPLLTRKHWASYHDIFSVRTPQSLHEIRPFSTTGRPTLEDIIRTTLTEIPHNVEFIDHETEWIAPQNPHFFSGWRLHRNSLHCIGFTCSEMASRHRDFDYENAAEPRQLSTMNP